MANSKSKRPSEYKSFELPFEATKVLDEDQGIVEHIITVFGVPDKGSPPDISHPGSFKKTIQERQDNVLVLDMHNMNSVMNVLGKPLGIEEVDRSQLPDSILEKFPEATGGVKATTKFFLDTPEGAGAFARIKNGGLREWSYGFDALDVDMSTVTYRGKKVRARNLRTIKLYEYSPVLWGLAESATLSAKKDVPDEAEDALPPSTPETKAVTSFQDYPLAGRDRRWDSSAAEKRIREWAGGEDDMDWAKYALAFMWHDSENPETYGAYKLPYIDIVSDEPHAVPRAIFTLTSATRGVDAADIPEEEKERIRNHVRRYYAKMREEFDDDSLVPAWDKAAEPEGEVKEDGSEPEAPGMTPAAVETDTPDPESAEPLSEKGEQHITIQFTLVPDVKDVDPETQAAIVKAITDALAEAGLSSTRDPEAADLPPAGGPAPEAKMRGNARTMGNVLEGTLHYAFTCLCDKWFIAGLIDRDERLLLSSLIGDALDLLHDGMSADLAMREFEDHYGMYEYYSLAPDLDAKAGRVLSARNAQKIQQALAVLHEVLMEAGLIGGEEEAAMHDDEDEEKAAIPRSNDSAIQRLSEVIADSLHRFIAESKATQQQPPQAGPGPQDPPTSPEAGPNSASPTSQKQDLLRLIEIEQAELELSQI